MIWLYLYPVSIAIASGWFFTRVYRHIEQGRKK